MITGAAGQIGSVFAKAIVANNGKVVLVDIDEEKGRTLAFELGEKQALFKKADITMPKEIDLAIQETLYFFHSLDSAVHCAYPKSKGWGTRFEDLNPKYLAEDLQMQLGGAIMFSQQLIHHFRQQEYGNLIHISSIQGIASPKFDHYEDTGMASPIEYSAIKASIIAITRYLAKYCKNQNIRVNCISPGGILENQQQTFIERYRSSCNSKGMLDAEDLVGTLLYLLSDKSKYVNGQNVIVDDGWSL